MKYYICIITLALACIIPCPNTPYGQTSATEADKYNKQDIDATNSSRNLKKHILVITSQPYVTEWFMAVNDSLRKHLLPAISSESKLSYEYIGGESFTDREYVALLCGLLKKKYAGIGIDLVIAVMPAGIQFMLDNGRGIFPGRQVIYVLPSKEQYRRISGLSGAGIVRSSTDSIQATIERIRVLIPDLRHIAVVSGSGMDDLNYLKTAESLLKGRGWPASVEYLEGLPADELADRLEKLPGHSAVLMLTYLQDRDGEPLTTVQVMNTVSERTAAPVFSFYDTVFGLGIVGGKLSSSKSFGEAIAETVLKIIRMDAIDHAVETAAVSRDIYDWRQLKKWNIPVKLLPPGSEIRFRIQPFWEEHLLKIIIISVVISIQAVSILALVINLKKRRGAEVLLRASEKKYHDIFDNSVIGIFQSTPGGVYLSVNPALAKLFGYESPREMVSGIGDIRREIYVKPEERDRFREILAEKGQVTGFQVEYKRRDDSRFWISITGKAIRDETGEVQYYEGTVEDITAQKEAEMELLRYREHLEALVKERTEKFEQTNAMLSHEISERNRAEIALKQSEKMYRDLVESANSVILRWKTDGTVTFLNTFAREFFGYTEPEIIGKSIVGTIVPARESFTGRDLPALINDIVKRPEAYAFNENENMRKSGETVWLTWANKPVINEEGVVTEILSVGNDITDRKRIEESLRSTLSDLAVAKERAESADRLKSAFLATMSHELRTPLNSIIGFTGIMLKGLAGPINEEQTRQLGMVQNAARHLLSLINDVLDISKIEAGQFEVSSGLFDVVEVIKNSAAVIKPMADKKGIEILMEIDPRVGKAENDRRRVEQVILNLVSNAVKFTDRGAVTICADLVPVYRPQIAGGDNVSVPAVRLSVRDTGIGILPEDMDGLFQPFRQIDTGLSRKNEGTGLGLAICKRLAGLMGGGISAESEWGRGSVFTFMFPVRGADEQNNSYD